jgi:hypothetical protein
MTPTYEPTFSPGFRKAAKWFRWQAFCFARAMPDETI